MLDIPCESDDSHVMSNIIFSEKYGKHSMRMSSASSDWRLKGLIGTTTDDLLWYSKHSFGYIISDVYSIAEPGFIAQSDACSTGIQEIAGLWLRFGTILFLRLIVKSFYCHYLPSTNLRREVVSYLQKNVH